MGRPTVVVFDNDAVRRQELHRALRTIAHTIPIARLSDLGRSWPEGAWFFIPDERKMLETLCSCMVAREQVNPVVVYSEKPETRQAISAILGGAVHYLSWPCSIDALVAGMQNASPAVERRLKRMAAHIDASQQLSRLTSIERQVLYAVRHGLSNKEIARELVTSPRTVEMHRSNALRRLGVSNLLGAVSLIIEAEQLDRHDVTA